MSRTADYTIKGFLYQFNKTLFEILKSPDGSTITAEGIVEDVEVVTASATSAIQCKYHEASEAFTPSQIYKPLLQMMYHFHGNPGGNVDYILFAHYPTMASGRSTLGKADFEAALSSTNKDFKGYVETLQGKIDLDTFNSSFTMEFGPSLEDLVAQVKDALEANGIPESDIDTLAYPNAINMIAQISVKHDPKERQITKMAFVTDLKSIRKTAISRWTLALHTRKQLLDARRKQLKTHLDINCRLRYFVVDPESFDDYDAEIVLFVSDYLDKYHFKQTHVCTPVLCLCTSQPQCREIRYRLYTKGIISEDGYIGGRFDDGYFFRTAFFRKRPEGVIERSFSLRLLCWEDHGIVLNNPKCDDLFILGSCNCDALDTGDVNVERLEAASLKEIKYLMGVSNAYE